MGIRLEHANICVRDIEAMMCFLKTAFTEFRVRGEGRLAGRIARPTIYAECRFHKN